MKVLVDFHHSSLLRSLIMLFEGRLGYKVYRPIGPEWFENGFWKINAQPDTAKQYLSYDQTYNPADGTPALNRYLKKMEDEKGVFYCLDPGGRELNRACSFYYVMNQKFDFLIATIPQHIEPFKQIIKRWQPQAKLIFQMGNQWTPAALNASNVMASAQLEDVPAGLHYIQYHQEFDTEIFKPAPVRPTKKIYSFINILQSMPRAWADFQKLEQLLPEFEFKSFGGQCRDGNMTGPQQLARKMREAEFIFHVKDNGDGFGHVLHNAYAVGRPVITRRSDYQGKLGGRLLEPGTCFDLDILDHEKVADDIRRLTKHRAELRRMGERGAKTFKAVVNYEQESKEIAAWLKNLV